MRQSGTPPDSEIFSCQRAEVIRLGDSVSGTNGLRMNTPRVSYTDPVCIGWRITTSSVIASPTTASIFS